MKILAALLLLILCILSTCIHSTYSNTIIINNKHIIKELCLTDDLIRSMKCKAKSPELRSVITSFDKRITQAPCYCHIKACGKYSVPKVFQSCKSGFVHGIKCGGCIRCAKDLGESCGGTSSSDGACRMGLVCEVNDNKEDVGVCVHDLANNTKQDKLYLRTKPSFNNEFLVKECARYLVGTDQRDNWSSFRMLQKLRNQSSSRHWWTETNTIRPKINGIAARRLRPDITDHESSHENSTLKSLGDLLLGNKDLTKTQMLINAKNDNSLPAIYSTQDRISQVSSRLDKKDIHDYTENDFSENLPNNLRSGGSLNIGQLPGKYL